MQVKKIISSLAMIALITTSIVPVNMIGASKVYAADDDFEDDMSDEDFGDDSFDDGDDDLSDIDLGDDLDNFDSLDDGEPFDEGSDDQDFGEDFEDEPAPAQRASKPSAMDTISRGVQTFEKGAGALLGLAKGLGFGNKQSRQQEDFDDDGDMGDDSFDQGPVIGGHRGAQRSAPVEDQDDYSDDEDASPQWRNARPSSQQDFDEEDIQPQRRGGRASRFNREDEGFGEEDIQPQRRGGRAQQQSNRRSQDYDDQYEGDDEQAQPQSRRSVGGRMKDALRRGGARAADEAINNEGIRSRIGNSMSRKRQRPDDYNEDQDDMPQGRKTRTDRDGQKGRRGGRQGQHDQQLDAKVHREIQAFENKKRSLDVRGQRREVGNLIRALKNDLKTAQREGDRQEVSYLQKQINHYSALATQLNDPNARPDRNQRSQKDMGREGQQDGRSGGRQKGRRGGRQGQHDQQLDAKVHREIQAFENKKRSLDVRGQRREVGNLIRALNNDLKTAQREGDRQEVSYLQKQINHYKQLATQLNDPNAKPDKNQRSKKDMGREGQQDGRSGRGQKGKRGGRQGQHDQQLDAKVHREIQAFENKKHSLDVRGQRREVGNLIRALNNDLKTAQREGDRQEVSYLQKQINHYKQLASKLNDPNARPDKNQRSKKDMGRGAQDSKKKGRRGQNNAQANKKSGNQQAQSKRSQRRQKAKSGATSGGKTTQSKRQQRRQNASKTRAGAKQSAKKNTGRASTKANKQQQRKKSSAKTRHSGQKQARRAAA